MRIVHCLSFQSHHESGAGSLGLATARDNHPGVACAVEDPLQCQHEGELEQILRIDPFEDNRLLSSPQRGEWRRAKANSLPNSNESFNFKVAAKIDAILTKIAPVLPVDATISILNPVIATGDFPTNLCAIKLLLELVSVQGDEITDHHLNAVMPNIAKVRSPPSRFDAMTNSIFSPSNSVPMTHSRWFEKRRYFVSFDCTSRWVKNESNQNFRC